MSYPVEKSEDYWKRELTKEQYRILRKKGTELAFTGDFLNTEGHGKYICAGCGNELFDSDTKFDSKHGWPSFSDVINSKNIELKDDRGLFGKRIEVVCAKCGGHLGHVFKDGPKPNGKRYCINSAALLFKEKKK